jgi:hypothetical protein
LVAFGWTISARSAICDHAAWALGSDWLLAKLFLFFPLDAILR